MIYLVTGWPGAGKSTVAVQHAIYRYAAKGRRVVANFPIDFDAVCHREGSALSAASVQVIADRPKRADLDAIGHGGEREDVAGMLIIDEAGGWLNARSWNGAERESIIDWLTQSRKKMWDIYLIAQAPGMLDKQVRDAVCEGVVRIRRLDRFKMLGVSMPRVHIAIVRYGLEANAPILERWFYRGGEAQSCFGSYRVFGTDDASYCVLPATHTKWRHRARFLLNADGRRAQWLAAAVFLGAVTIKPLFAFVMLGAIAALGRYWGRDRVQVPQLLLKRDPVRKDLAGGMGAAAPHAGPQRAPQLSLVKPRGRRPGEASGVPAEPVLILPPFASTAAGT